MPEQITGLSHEGTAFLPLSPPLLRESAIAWRADDPSKALQDYIQIVKELSGRWVTIDQGNPHKRKLWVGLTREALVQVEAPAEPGLPSSPRPAEQLNGESSHP